MLGLGAIWLIGPAFSKTQRRIGFLAPLDYPPVVRSFRRRMQELGQTDGGTVLIDYRHAAGRFELLPDYAAQLVKAGCDVIVSHVTEASIAARRATTTIPIVMIGVGDPIAAGLVDSLARPGGNVTGTSSAAPLVAAKALEIMIEILPKRPAFAVLWNPRNRTFQAQVIAEVEKAAEKLGVRIELLAMSDPERFEAVFKSMAAKRIQGLLFLPDPLFNQHRLSLIRLASTSRLPAMFFTAGAASDGALMAYGPDYEHLAARAADYVDKILRGAEPGRLAVEQPTKFHLSINLRTAKALGIGIPHALLVRADEVIQ